MLGFQLRQPGTKTRPSLRRRLPIFDSTRPALYLSRMRCSAREAADPLRSPAAACIGPSECFGVTRPFSSHRRPIGTAETHAAAARDCHYSVRTTESAGWSDSHNHRTPVAPGTDVQLALRDGGAVLMPAQRMAFEIEVMTRRAGLKDIFRAKV